MAVTRYTGAVLLMVVASPVQSQEAISANFQADGQGSTTVTLRPNVKPAMTVPNVEAVSIKLDGVLDDPVWSKAAVASNFSETFPGDQTKPPIGITALVTYDEKNLYVAFQIEDDPAQVRASLTARDNIWDDDYVGLLLDPYAANAWCYFIAANPYGIQGDTRIVQGGNEDLGFNLVFDSEGQINENGYVVEMAIPFRSIRFPEGDEQKWNINFWITHPRSSRSTYSWAAIDRDDPCFLCQFGSIDGIKGVSSRNDLELLPAAVGGQAGALEDGDDPNSGFVNESVRLEASLGVKYAFNSNIVGDLALNPDFSQVEADAAQIDVNTTYALFYPERRPFFQEGSELYETQIQTVYTRSINNPDVAGKMTGRFGNGNAAYLGAVDAATPIIVPFEEQSGIIEAGRSVSNIARYKRTLGDGSYFGGLVTDKRYVGGGSGTTVAADGTLRFLHNFAIEGQFVASQTTEPNDTTLTEDLEDLRFGKDKQYTAAFDGESFAGYAAYLSLEREARFWSFDIDYNTATPTFRADAGFVTRNSVHQIGVWNGLDFRPETKLIDQITPWFIAGYEWNYEGVRKDEYLWVGIQGRFTGQTNAGAGALLFSNERFKGTDFRGIRRAEIWFNSAFSNPLQFGSQLTVGKSIARGEDVPVLGNGVDLQVWGMIRPSSRIRIEPSFSFSKLDHPDTGEAIFSGYIGRVRFNYQFTRRLFLRLITQYNEFDHRLEVDPLLTYSVNPYTEFYLGSTHDFRDFDETPGTKYVTTGRQVFFKVRYLVRT